MSPLYVILVTNKSDSLPFNFVLQFRPVVPAPHPQEFVPVASQNFQHVGRGVPPMNVRLPPPVHQPQFPQPVQQLPARSGPPGHGMLPQAIPLPVAQPIRNFAPELPVPQPNVLPPNNVMSNLSAPRPPLSSSYTVSFQIVVIVDSFIAFCHPFETPLGIELINYTFAVCTSLWSNAKKF